MKDHEVFLAQGLINCPMKTIKHNKESGTVLKALVLILIVTVLFFLWRNNSPGSSSNDTPQPTIVRYKSYESIISGITSVRDDMRLIPDGDIEFNYEDSGDWEADNRLKNISVNDLPLEEELVPVLTPDSHRKRSFFPANDYEVTGLPWKVLITNSHSRGLYEEYKLNKGSEKYTLTNWDYHNDVNVFEDDYIFDPRWVTIANWVSNAYYNGIAKAPVYWFNCYAGKPDSDYLYPGTWDMEIPLSAEKSAPIDGQIINITPDDTSIAISHFKDLAARAEKNSIWLSLCGDCFSKPEEEKFDATSFRAKLLKEVLSVARKYPEKIAFIHFARSPDYAGDVPGLNKFFVEQLKSISDSKH